jgi:plastocyanin
VTRTTALPPLAAVGAAGLVLLAGPGLLSEPPPAATGEIRVDVRVIGPDRNTVPAAGSVVWIPEPGPVGKAEGKPRLASKAKRFEPRVLVVPAGTTVSFPNEDAIYHNVFSPSGKEAFDLGLYRNGASKSKTFTTPGLVRIYCNIHPQMAAYLLVVDGLLFAEADAGGSAVLSGIPPGRRPVRVWDERGGDWSGAVEVVAGKTTELAVLLDGTAFRETPHKNKHGRDYPPPGDDDARY